MATSRTSTRRTALLAAATLALGIFGAAQAQERYPSKPITIVIPSAAGSGQDAVARLIGQELAKAWNQAVIVDNKPGAGTTIGTRFGAQAPKDGHTTLLTFTAHVQNVTVALPNGNRDPHMAPHGVFQCRAATGASAEDCWVAIAARDERDWRALAAVIGGSELASNRRYATLAARQQLENEIEKDGRRLDSRAHTA